MKIEYISDKIRLNNFLEKQKYSQILQSWQWGQFQEDLGLKIFRLGAEENNELLGVATIIKKFLPMSKSYFFCPRGPILDLRFKNSDFRFEILEFLFREILKLAKKERAVFLRFEPTNKFRNSDFGFRIYKSIDIEPSKTLMLDLKKPEEELLKEMHQKTRYNIRLAQKKGIKVISLRGAASQKEGFKEFWKISNETCRRDNFRLHAPRYYYKMLKCENIELLLAKHQGRSIAVNIISSFGDTVSYLHGASANEYRNLMAPYLLQWHAIKTAKDQGYKYYDFCGIDEKKWPGVTRFKKGYGGFEIDFPGTFDLIFNKGYYKVYQLMRKIKRKI